MKKTRLAVAALSAVALAGCASGTPNAGGESSPAAVQSSPPVSANPGVSVDPANKKFCDDLQALMQDSGKTKTLDQAKVDAVVAGSPAVVKDQLPDYLAQYGKYLATKDETIAQQPSIAETSQKLVQTCG